MFKMVDRVKRMTAPLFLLSLFAFSTLSMAQDEEAPAVAQAVYIELEPAFVANYGGPGRLRYLRTEISLRIDEGLGVNDVRHHMPAIRHAIVVLLSKQEDENISSQEGKELLRLDLLDVVRQVIDAEEGDNSVTDLLFNAFIVQR